MLAPPMTVAHASACPDLVRQGRITEALSALSAVSSPDVETRALILECRLARGELDLASVIGEQLATETPLDTADAALVDLVLGDLAAAHGRDDDALTHFRAVGERLEDPVALPWRAGAALSLMRTGSRREAASLATEQLELARASGSAYTLVVALRTAAACLAEDHVGRLREALSLSLGRFDRLAAQLSTDLAGVLALTSTGDDAIAEARALLRAAEQYADAQDLWPLHARVRRVLERLGETPQTPRAELVSRLTESELRVARLATHGATNRAIAAEVGVSVKAVEWHLSHAYRKLGIRGRADLPQLLRLG